MSTVQLPSAVSASGAASSNEERVEMPLEGCLYSPGSSGGVWRVTPLGDNSIASACYDGVVRVYQRTAGVLSAPKCLRIHRKEALNACVLGDGRFVTGSSDGSIGVWRSSTAAAIKTMREGKPKTGIYSIADIGEGKIATGSCQKPKKVKGRWDHVIKLWDITTGRTEGILRGHTGGVAGMTYMGENVLASASGDKSVRIWSLETLDEIGGHKLHKDYVYGIARLGKRLVSCSRDRTVRIYDVAQETAVGALIDGDEGLAHDSTVYDVNTSGPMVVTASRDGLVKLWDARTMKKVVSLAADDGFVYAANFMRDGSIIAGTAGKQNVQTAEAEEAKIASRSGVSTRGSEKPNSAHVVLWDQRK